ncbi:MAG: peptidoglycan synthetase [Bacteroidales bacterium]|jgi:UDP-N-acetylmuramate: L-alanyl-gamma-D-glutamyl-meso-diaminopimelate ligase|nr:peptidoglycan synthetase [Bacteroidales bacterium]MBP7038763.1 peptidoglycan synthetase [Bacteroidales bacterium]MDI9552223.1 Mur ligase family protein [Bacteroidota bacterium]HPB13513.1 Mur ligase family protein [Bacteroidales bacterium]
MRIHFIAIGGAVMHNLAIALLRKGYEITGSDDEIFEPSRSRLAARGLLPEAYGWHPEKINRDIDIVILGMHARADNPELAKAAELGLKIMSFPEFLLEQTRNKKRIVVAGSHGKTTTTAMIMHVMKTLGIRFDYMVGSSIEGYETMVSLSDDSEFAVLEGDEYLSSPIDRRPKFHLYMPDIAVLNGIAWDHMNVFPTFENYVEQFRIFADKISPGGTLVYFEDDPEVKKIAGSARDDIKKIPYRVHGHFRNKTGFYAAGISRTVKLQFFGRHNMQNFSAAMEACLAAGISSDSFYDAIGSFSGTSGRLQLIRENEKGTFYYDFAHSPSKVKATVEAVAERYPDRNIVACFELHTFSSLNKNFLPFYKGSLEKASRAIVYFNPGQFEQKRLEPFSPNTVKEGFGGNNLTVFNNSSGLMDHIKNIKLKSPVWLFMSSGDFGGCNLKMLAEELLA